MNPRRELGVALVLCGAGAAVVLVAAGRIWVRSAEVCTGDICRESMARGAAADVARALGLAALAGVVGVVASRGRGRTSVGAVLLLVGAGIAAVAVRAFVDPRPAVESWNTDSFGALRLAAGALRPTPWPLICAAGGVAVLGSGLFVLVRGPGWSSLSERYSGAAGAPAAQPEASLWDALSRGEDPT